MNHVCFLEWEYAVYNLSEPELHGDAYQTPCKHEVMETDRLLTDWTVFKCDNCIIIIIIIATGVKASWEVWFISEKSGEKAVTIQTLYQLV